MDVLLMNKKRSFEEEVLRKSMESGESLDLSKKEIKILKRMLD
jgi:hypothetical protein